jgi:hypothetical protein
MDSSRSGGGAKGSRPEAVNNYMVRLIVITGCVWMFLDAMFTLIKAYEVFVVSNFFTRAAIAFCATVACVAAQKNLFELFIHPSKQEQFRTIWESGVLGKIGVVCLSIVVFAMIHFSWIATGSGIGVTEGAFLVPNFGIPDLASLSQYFSSALFGLVGAFFDEGMFFSARLLSDKKD